MKEANMSWGATAGIAILTGIVSVAATIWLVYWIVEWFRLRSHDGADLGYYIVFAPVGLLCGVAIGIVISRLVPGFWLAQGLSLAAVLALCALGTLVARSLGEVAPELEGEKLLLQLEVRFPPGWQPDADARKPEGRYCQLLVGPGQTIRSTFAGEVAWRAAKQIEGQWIVPCSVALLSSRKNRLVSLTLGKSNTDFGLDMPAKPSAANKQWSGWIVEGFAAAPGKKPPPGYSYRYRVQKIGELRDAETQAASDFFGKRDQAAAALPADAPMSAWIPFFEDPDGTPAQYRWGGADRLERRTVAPRAVELAPLLQSDDPKVLRQAVFTIGALYQTPEPLIEPLIAAGKLVPELIRDARTKDTSKEFGYSERQKAETRALQYFSMWKNAMNNSDPALRPKFKGILEDIVREAGVSQSRDDVNILEREAKESLSKINL